MAGIAREGALRAVSIGGGTGQPNAIRALREIGCATSAIVAMADDGGSTGIIRSELGIVPPGDVRKCLVAMADDPLNPLTSIFERRFRFADNHALGNLILAALTEETGSFAEAVAICSRMLGCQGPVYPSTLENLVLCGVTRDGMEFHGEAALGSGPCALSKVWLLPHNPRAYQPAVRAILDADIVVLGPGSLFTSVLPNILVPGILDAIRRTPAIKVFVCSKADMQGETWGLTAEEHLDALLSHGLEGAVDVALIHRPDDSDASLATRSFRALTDVGPDDDPSTAFQKVWGYRPVRVTDDALRRMKTRVPNVIVRDFSDPDLPTWHSVSKLAAVLQGVAQACPSRPR